MSDTKIINFKSDIDFQDNSVVSKTIIDKDAGTVTLFAFSENQSLSEHTAPYDALVQVVEGSVEIKIDSKPYTLNEGESIIMPANIPHVLKALSNFKMLLVMIKSN